MKVTQTYHKLKPDTINGFGVQIITTYTSFDKKEIDDVVDYLQKNIGSGLVSESSESGVSE